MKTHLSRAGLLILAIIVTALLQADTLANVQDIRVYQEMNGVYPPLATLLFFLINTLPSTFAEGWILFLGLALLLTLFYTHKYLDEKNTYAVPAIAILSIFLLGFQITMARYDVLILLLMFLTWKAFEKKRFRDSAIFLTVAGGLKLLPIIVLSILWKSTPKKNRDAILHGFLIGLGITIILPFALLGEGFVEQNIQTLLSEHAGRGVQIESVWSGLHMLGQNLIGEKSIISVEALAWDNAQLGREVQLLAIFLLFAGLIQIFTRTKPKSFEKNFFMMIVWMLAVSPVLSPQYLVWVLPLILLWALDQKHARNIIICIVVIGAATQWIFPLHYREFVLQTSILNTMILNMRNIALFVLIGLIYKSR